MLHEHACDLEKDANTHNLIDQRENREELFLSTTKKQGGILDISRFSTQWEAFVNYRKDRTAPVDSMGCEFLADESESPKVVRFQHLVAGMLSPQTRDEMTSKVVAKLQLHGLTVEKIDETPLEQLSELLHGVSFHRVKAASLKCTVRTLIEQYDGDVPDDIKSLLKLKGVGPKIATMVLAACYQRHEGIVVDVHVHRIANRIGWIKTSSPKQTKDSLESFIPKDLWSEVNLVLVGVGQQLCTGASPKCGLCPNRLLDCSFGWKRRDRWKSDETKGVSRVVMNHRNGENAKACKPLIEVKMEETIEPDKHERELLRQISASGSACKQEERQEGFLKLEDTLDFFSATPDMKKKKRVY
eukprot:GDKJ01048587.1.p1 GENE.GDKJ01048587.1~~GDKJ01048587.1.p1  ORF type:complete len:357 (-),score=41.77 GDKJ01048587.1:130-1200(-)